MKRLCLLVALLALGCGSDSAPSAPTPPATPTRIIRLGGNLNFGDVLVGTVRSDGILTISNDGTATLTYTSISSPCAGAGGAFSASPTSGAVAPAQTVNVGVRFAPLTAQNCTGLLTVAGDQTSGTNTIALTATAVNAPRPTFSRTGSGDTVFDMPADVARVRIIGIYSGSSSNFIIRIGGRLIVNELLGTFWGRTRYDGVLLTGGGGVTVVTNSSGVAWSFEEVGR